MKFRNILFPVDFSDCSRALNSQVEYVARRFSSDVTLLHVFENPYISYGIDGAAVMSTECLQGYIEREKQRLSEYCIDIPGNRLRRVVAEGDAAWQIKTYTKDNNFDLVMMGTHGYGPVRRLLLGSVTMKVLHDVSCPVWTYAPGKMLDGKLTGDIKKVVCALELNDEVVRLLRFVSDIGTALGASVRLIHSVPDDASRPYRYFDSDLHRFLVKLAEEEISKLQSQARTYFNVDFVEIPIGQATAIAAAQQQAGLVVIGRGTAQGVFGTLRTHAYDIIREAHCPVLSYCAAGAETDAKLASPDAIGEQLLTKC